MYVHSFVCRILYVVSLEVCVSSANIALMCIESESCKPSGTCRHWCERAGVCTLREMGRGSGRERVSIPSHRYMYTYKPHLQNPKTMEANTFRIFSTSLTRKTIVLGNQVYYASSNQTQLAKGKKIETLLATLCRNNPTPTPTTTTTTTTTTQVATDMRVGPVTSVCSLLFQLK